MNNQLPQVTRVYQHPNLDSTRWQHYTPRDDDIIIVTSYKSGTTWMQMIVKHLIIQNGKWDSFHDISPWLEANFSPIEDIISTIEAQTHRRFIKSHLALDGLPYFEHLKYILVCRDPRDVFMSWWNHYGTMTDDRLPPYDGNIHRNWQLWLTRGWFEWESEGYPLWGNMHHARTFWDYRHLPNILFVHYNNMLDNLHAEIRRVADFIEINVSDEYIDKVVE